MSDAKPKPPPAPHSSRAPHASSQWLLRALVTAAAVGATGVLALGLLVGVALAIAYPNLPQINGLADYRPKLPLRIYSADGALLSEFGEERRNFVPIAEIPAIMRNAVLAVEDARFYQHGGVDYLGIVRAGLANVGEARSQGASTITMQVARNFYLSSEKTFTRKIYEILLSLKIESQLSKDQILELYMNQIYLGQRAYGFGAAAEIYFGKPLKDVTVAEAAMLAGLPKAPSAFNPIANPKRATLRQQYIIDRMLDGGYISAAERDAAKAQKLRYRPASEVPIHAEYLAETARQIVFAKFGDETYSRGLNVTVTAPADEQIAAYRALRQGIMNFEKRQVYRGPEAYVDLPASAADLDLRIAEVLADHSDRDDLRAAVAIEVSSRKVIAMLQSGETVTITGAGLAPVASGLTDKAGPKRQIRPGAVVRVTKGAQGDWVLTQLPEVEGAFVALDPHTGAIRALVGGFDFGKNKFNHVTQAWRQPGSAFKPFIYSAALEKGFTPTTMVNDAPLFFDATATGSQPWEPKNYDGKFDGPMTLRTALAQSKNMVSIRVLQAVGPATAQRWVSRFGFEAAKHPPFLTMALGAGSTTPLQLASGFGVFANGGYLVSPQLIRRITDSKGQVLFEAAPVVKDESLRVIDARNAFVMTNLLQEVTRSGTAARVQSTLKRTDVYGKTGTTNDSLDAWFAGWQHGVIAVAWIGYDQPRKLGDRETGGGLALPVWLDFMSVALKKQPVHTLEVPERVVQRAGEWYFEEFASGAGINRLSGEDPAPKAPSDEERRGILDLFKR